MTSLTSAFRGNRLVARVLRSSSWLVLGYGGSQALRLASNLILARLLFPEAFGLMALVNVVTMGLMALQLITIYFSFRVCDNFWKWRTSRRGAVRISR